METATNLTEEGREALREMIFAAMSDIAEMDLSFVAPRLPKTETEKKKGAPSKKNFYAASIKEVNHKTAPEFWFEPGCFWRHDIP